MSLFKNTKLKRFLHLERITKKNSMNLIKNLRFDTVFIYNVIVRAFAGAEGGIKFEGHLI
jgi:hypothetical protein